MGFFKKLFGFEKQAEEEAASEKREQLVQLHPSESAARVDRDRAEKLGVRDKRGRPALVEAAAPSQSIDDVLALREAGEKKAAMKLIEELDKGQGLRAVLHVAMVLEEGDQRALRQLLPTIENEANGWKLLLQTAAALAGDRGKPLVEAAESSGAPAWALAWTRAMSEDEETKRKGLVDLLFEDAALARTVAARDLKIEGAVSDGEAGPRYAAFAHGRDSIRRFDAERIAATIAKARTR